VSAVVVSRTTARRLRVDRVMTIVLALFLLTAFAILVWVLFFVAQQGLKYLGPEFLTRTPPGNPATPGGGFLNGIIGSLIVVGIATAIAIPLGVLAAVYLVEYGGSPYSRTVRFFTDVLLGIPTIVTGAFVYAIWVIRFGFSGIAGSIALAIVMLPLIIRTTEEMLHLVPRELREASYALGTSKARTIVSVVLPTALPGIVTGGMLAVARAMGETAPLLLTALGNDLFVQTNPTKRMATLSLQIFGNAITGFKAAQARAWAGALTLIGIILVFTVIARVAATRSRVRA
jgi:phosphate transport system permease protein